MLLKEHLNEYTKEQLVERVHSFGLQPPEEISKDELIDGTLRFFLSDVVMRTRIACLTREQMTLFRKACEEPQNVSMLVSVDAMQLSRYWLGCFEDTVDKFSVYEDVAEAFKRIDDDDFKAANYKLGWMSKCLIFFIEYYAIAPLEVIYELYSLKIKDDFDIAVAMLKNMPLDIVEAATTTMEKLGMHDWPKEDPLYSEKGLLVSIPIFNGDGFEEMVTKQMDKEFYIPTVQQIEEICRLGYEASNMAYKRFEKYLIKNLKMSYDQAEAWCLEMWKNSYNGESPTVILNKMVSRNQEHFENQKQVDELAAVIVDAHNNTRTRENRGHKPNDLKSSEPGVVKKEKNESVRTDIKVYPNDPCPCGSGKKYKKCCGKNA